MEKEKSWSEGSQDYSQYGSEKDFDRVFVAHTAVKIDPLPREHYVN